MLLQLRVLIAVLLLFSFPAGAQIKMTLRTRRRTFGRRLPAEYTNHLENLKALVAACAKDAATCDAKKVGDDERVEGGGFQTRWSWLRDTLTNAHNPALADRDKLLQQASARLDEDAALAGGSGSASGEAFQRARKKADDVLVATGVSHREEQSYVEREIAKFWQWLDSIFGGVSRFGKRSPWLVPVMEWGSMTLAAAGLLTWVFRTYAATASGGTNRVEREFGDLAEGVGQLGGAGAGRGGESGLACSGALPLLGGDRHDRGPQVVAAESGAYAAGVCAAAGAGVGMHQALRRLTQLFERIWYGLRPAAESDYTSALLVVRRIEERLMAASRDRRIVLGILGGMIVLLIAFSIFSPANDDSNPSPTTYNSGSAGAKAVYLVLGELGYGAQSLGGDPLPI